MTTKLRIYMAGPVDALADLGRSWRVAMAEAIRARGHEPVWPTYELQAVDQDDLGDAAVQRARWHWARDIARAYNPEMRKSADPRLACLARIAYDADAFLAYWSDDAGLGTRAEIAVARWLGRPVASICCGASNSTGYPEGVACYAREWEDGAAPAALYSKAIDWIERQAAKNAEVTR